MLFLKQEKIDSFQGMESELRINGSSPRMVKCDSLQMAAQDDTS